jgi:SPP1 family predicted phage head-tail adaptor
VQRVVPWAMLLIALSLLGLHWRLDGMETAMKAGELDRRILIQRPVKVRGSTGEELTGWVDVANPWAKFERLSGGEEIRVEQRTNRQRVRFTIRYRSGIDAKMSVVYDGERYEIEDVGEAGEGRRDGLMLEGYVREVVSGS